MRQKVLLGTLGVLLAIVAWVYLVPGGDDAPPRAAGRAPGLAQGSDPETGAAAAPARPGPGGLGVAGAVDSGSGAASAVTSASAASAASAQLVETLRLDALGRTPPGFTSGRDPWRYVDPPPPPPPPPPKPPSAAELRARQEAEEAARRLAEEQARLAAIEAAKPHPPPFTWTYLGNFGPPHLRIAVFTDGRKVWNARQGDTLDNKFIVAQIGYESVDIAYVGFPTVPATRLAVKH
jgi:hypothetical protein